MNLAKAQTIATGLLKEHGLYAQGWRFDFDTAVRRFGCCKYSQKRITLSQKLTSLNDEARVTNTILHEIAHALAGHKAGHGPAWKAKAVMIGCDGERLYNSAVVATPERRYKGTCPNCSRVITRHRRDKIACGQCCRKYNRNQYSPAYLIQWQ